MDLGWGNKLASKFATNVGLITSHGPNGQNIMAAEWTYYVSWSPALMAVHIGGGREGKATAENISATKEFGISIAASGQNVVASIAGAASGRDLDKIAVLRDMGFELYNAKHIKALMVKGAATSIECRLVEVKELGDHTMFIGEVLDISTDEGKMPLIYQFGKYHLLGEQIHKPGQDVLDKIEQLRQKHKKTK